MEALSHRRLAIFISLAALLAWVGFRVAVSLIARLPPTAETRQIVQADILAGIKAGAQKSGITVPDNVEFFDETMFVGTIVVDGVELKAYKTPDGRIIHVGPPGAGIVADAFGNPKHVFIDGEAKAANERKIEAHRKEIEGIKAQRGRQIP